MDYSSLPKILHVFDAASALLAVFLVGIIILRTVRSRGGFKLPPGPKPLPLVGNLFDLPKELDWVHWAKHKDVYGPISSVTVFGQTLIILNDLKAATDLFETRSNIYSNRPTLTFGGEMCVYIDSIQCLPNFNCAGADGTMLRRFSNMTRSARRTGVSYTTLWGHPGQ